ncbi:hypothetical protein KKD37_03385, partial [Patescibacteria group bacterium]|nr:hypothetical protein [Patescibacteria group bacterium]
MKRSGLAQIPLMIVLLLMAIAVPAATKLVQDNQDNRNKAANNDSGSYCSYINQIDCANGCIPDANGGKCKTTAATPTSTSGGGGGNAGGGGGPTTAPIIIGNGQECPTGYTKTNCKAAGSFSTCECVKNSSVTIIPTGKTTLCTTYFYNNNVCSKSTYTISSDKTCDPSECTPGQVGATKVPTKAVATKVPTTVVANPTPKEGSNCSPSEEGNKCVNGVIFKCYNNGYNVYRWAIAGTCPTTVVANPTPKEGSNCSPSEEGNKCVNGVIFKCYNNGYNVYRWAIA